MSAEAERILFYRTNEEFGAFSNFAKFPITLEGQTWPTSEHYFQGQKFIGSAHAEAIRNAQTAAIAASMGRDRTQPLRPDWNVVRDQVMLVAVRAKFHQHESLRQLLLSTGDAILVEHTEKDRYWADGGDGSGQNKLGQILMKVRAEIASEV